MVVAYANILADWDAWSWGQWVLAILFGLLVYGSLAGFVLEMSEARLAHRYFCWFLYVVFVLANAVSYLILKQEYLVTFCWFFGYGIASALLNAICVEKMWKPYCLAAFAYTIAFILLLAFAG